MNVEEEVININGIDIAAKFLTLDPTAVLRGGKGKGKAASACFELTGPLFPEEITEKAQVDEEAERNKVLKRLAKHILT